MGAGKGLDWSKTGTVVAMAEWLRAKSGALAVLVVRVDDAALVADPRLAPSDAEMLLQERMPRLVEDLELARVEKRKGGRLELEPAQE